MIILHLKVVDYNIRISESGENYTQKIEVNQVKNTALFEVPAHPGVDRSDVLHDFNQVSFSVDEFLLNFHYYCKASTLFTFLHINLASLMQNPEAAQFFLTSLLTDKGRTHVFLSGWTPLSTSILANCFY